MSSEKLIIFMNFLKLLYAFLILKLHNMNIILRQYKKSLNIRIIDYN